MNTSPPRNLLLWLVALNAALLVASNAAGAKMIALPLGLTASATVFSYALSFMFTDLISELYGRREANAAVRVGFVGLIVSVVFFQVAMRAPPATGWTGQDAYVTTLGLGPRLLIAGWTSYMVSQHIDIWIFHRLREATSGRFLWLRNNASTMVSQLIDSIIFMTIAFYGIFPLATAILGQYLVKVLIAAVDTPVIYGVVYLVSKRTSGTESLRLSSSE